MNTARNQNDSSAIRKLDCLVRGYFFLRTVAEWFLPRYYTSINESVSLGGAPCFIFLGNSGVFWRKTRRLARCFDEVQRTDGISIGEGLRAR